MDDDATTWRVDGNRPHEDTAGLHGLLLEPVDSRHILYAVCAADIAVNPAGANAHYVATRLDPYFDGPVAEVLLRSGDGGRTWHPGSAGLSNLNIKTIAISRPDPATIFAGSSGNSAFVGVGRRIR